MPDAQTATLLHTFGGCICPRRDDFVEEKLCNSYRANEINFPATDEFSEIGTTFCLSNLWKENDYFCLICKDKSHVYINCVCYFLKQVNQFCRITYLNLELRL